MEYNTSKRKILLDFLEQNVDKKFSASEIQTQLPQISLSAVYRNLSRLEKEGLISRHISPEKKDVFFEYKSEHCHGTVHLCCTKCKKTFHLDEQTFLKLKKVFDAQNFLIDANNTTIYGICKNCLN